MALLNTPHPSEKLARWGLILQDVDLVIRYRPGRKMLALHDALYCSPVNKEDRVNFAPVRKDRRLSKQQNIGCCHCDGG